MGDFQKYVSGPGYTKSGQQYTLCIHWISHYPVDKNFNKTNNAIH